MLPQLGALVEADVRSTHADEVRGSGASAAAEPPSVATDSPRGRRGLRYLPGLDGIRALAIIGVLLFHADIPGAQGGFLGVDLFFVLSGFLITSLLLTEISATGRLNYAGFYLRRARRLLPAMFATLGLSLVLAWLFARDALSQVLKDIPFALTYITNWAYVFRNESYFQAIGRPPLLQHLWSLAIEEQFYLIWPSVVVLLAWLFKRYLTRAVLVTAVVGAAVSTALLAWVSATNGYPDLADPSPAYFATHTHSMGIMVGAALATLFAGRFSQREPSRATQVTASLIGTVGVVGVVASFIWLSQYTSALYRGGLLVFALVCALAVAGAAVPGSLFGTVFGRQPLRYIGQRSYGLYLFHWPIFMLLRPGQDIALTGWANTALRLALTFAVAELSYRYIEMPVRTGALLRWWRGDTSARRTWLGRPQAWRRVAVVSAATVAAIALVAGVSTAQPAKVVARPVLPHVVFNHAKFGPFIPEALPPAVKPVPRVVHPRVVPIVRASTWLIGDSVMLGARGGLGHQFSHMRINAVVARQPREFPKIVKQLRSQHALPRVVIIHMGTNGYVSAPILRHVLFQLRGVPRVILVTVHVPRPWTDGSNIMIRKLASHYRNVVIADWATYANGHPGWFVPDGAHLTPSGVKAYSALLAEAVN